MKSLSIIIPHYNSWEMLSELLMTIPVREFIEVIVIDDHTKDNGEMLPKMQEEFPHVLFYISYENKKGAGAARNRGLDVATGEWLLFADADDKFLPDLLTKIEPYFKTDFDIVFYTPTSFFEDKEGDSLRHQTFERYINEYLASNQKSKELALRYNYSSPWSKLIRYQLVKEHNIQFDEVMVANDVMFSAKIGKYAEAITATGDKIYAVRQTAGSITSVVSEKNFRARFDIWINMVNYMQENIYPIEFKEMNISVIPKLVEVIQNKLGLRNLMYVLKSARKNSIAIIDKRIFNPKFLIQSFRKQKALAKSDKRTTINE